jgi:hypothetical protein
MNRARLRNIPTFADQAKAFGAIDAILARLAEGWIHAERGEPVFLNRPDGRWYNIPKALEGWVEFWARLDKHYRLGLDLEPISRLGHKLHIGTPITAAEVAACVEIVKACKRAYRRMDVHDVHKVVRTQLIANQVELAGLSGVEA